MGNQTAFAEAAQQPSNDTKDVNSGVTISAEAQSSLQSTKSYKLVKSATGNNLYVEAKEYDPLAHHRKHDKAHDKGQGLGFMFCCFKQPQTEENEPNRFGYEIEAQPSTTNKAD